MMAHLSIKDFPDDVYRSLKLACVSEGTTIRAKVIDLIREYVQKQERKKGKN